MNKLFKNLSPDEINIVQRYLVLKKLLVISKKRREYGHKILFTCESNKYVNIDEQRRILDIFNDNGLFVELQPQERTKLVKKRNIIIIPGSSGPEVTLSGEKYIPDNPIVYYFVLNDKTASKYYGELDNEVKSIFASTGVARKRINSVSSIKDILSKGLNEKTKYENITISFINPFKVRIKVGSMEVTADYREMGFSYIRHGKVKPFVAWGLLQAIATDTTREYATKNNVSISNFKQQVLLLNRILTAIFGRRRGNPIYYSAKNRKYLSKINMNWLFDESKAAIVKRQDSVDIEPEPIEDDEISDLYRELIEPREGCPC